MNRLYVVESTPSLTGALADHRLAVRPSEVEPVARALGGRAGRRRRRRGRAAPGLDRAALAQRPAGPRGAAAW